MKSFATLAAFAAGANALAIRSDSCCFELTASGGASGTLGQLSDGQNRIGGGLPPATYCISSSGIITDSNGRGCILTPPTTQWQCDEGATGTSGFSVTGSGDLAYNGNTTFVACQTGDNGELNIYTNPPSADVSGCVDVTLEADKCAAPTSSSVAPTTSSSATPVPVSSKSPSVVVVTVTDTVCVASYSTTLVQPTTSATPVPVTTSSAVETSTTLTSTSVETSTTLTSSTPVPETSSSVVESSTPLTSSTPVPETTSSTTPTSTKTATPTSSATTCGTSLVSGSYEYPHLIIPIDSSSPNTAAGTQYNGEISSTVSTIFDFDIPASDSGKTCSLVFLFPEQQDLETSSFTFSGDGKIDFAELSSPATQSTTYNNAPSVAQDYGVFTVAPGNSYVISTFDCPAGDRVAYELKNAGSTNLTYFEDWNPSPIGLFITVC
ncbi:hypothetical protein UA08_01156 [Talaromyces atroroseus]|uniref:Uncharacterized protein n=1 Tax=Talaromyces atroroseus TaxID=1441469 RepID=A0A1Q5QBT3_TALAT|nr:hypothetical protein UA08_01156 [Talaromyces atroroseus]OKL63341.1 hypothetical protein UA08_01156 [Talaromyces atroroseus]